ncbi:unnamed protein product, partial [Mesorhabditis spiculigera]
MPEHPGAWDCLPGVPPMTETIIPLPAVYASQAFFSQLMALMQSNHRQSDVGEVESALYRASVDPHGINS